jgi:hypothetical protein
MNKLKAKLTVTVRELGLNTTNKLVKTYKIKILTRLSKLQNINCLVNSTLKSNNFSAKHYKQLNYKFYQSKKNYYSKAIGSLNCQTLFNPHLIHKQPRFTPGSGMPGRAYALIAGNYFQIPCLCVEC